VWTWLALIGIWESYSGYRLWHYEAHDDADARAGAMAGMVFGPIYISIVMASILIGFIVLIKPLARAKKLGYQTNLPPPPLV
jgi:hypothetical protein